MARFRIGGSGPDGRGLGCIAGIAKRRFDKSGEIYKTDASGEVQTLRQCPYVEEIGREAASLMVVATPSVSIFINLAAAAAQPRYPNL